MKKSGITMVKFVRRDGDRIISPGARGTIDYSKPGTRLEVAAAPVEHGQCASGIHALHLTTEPLDPNNIVFGDFELVLLHDCDVVYEEPTGKCRLAAATVGDLLPHDAAEYKQILTGNGSRPWCDTALNEASCAGKWDVVQWLVEHGAANLDTALNEASYAGKLDVVQWLVDRRKLQVACQVGEAH